MKTTIAAIVALAACASTQVFAQSKEDVITFSLSGQKQVSVSTSATLINAGLWSQQPHFYKSGVSKVTDKDIIKFIAWVNHQNANYYSAKAQLVLVQGELSGFFNITPDLGESYPENDHVDIAQIYEMDGDFITSDGDSSTDLRNSTDSTFVTMDNGHHLEINNTDQINDPPGGVDLYPVGHLQPWGQIYVKDTGGNHSVDSPLCENVTYFFALSVEECYDCFYMNSFVSDASFKTLTQSSAGQPPCCTTESALIGKGKDRYYLTLSFDNTVNNPYLDYYSSIWVGVDGAGSTFYPPGQNLPGDAIVPDAYNTSLSGTAADTFNSVANQGDYHDLINFRRANFLPYEARFTLNGILTYTWNLQFVNKQDIAPDFVGTATYPVSGYGFVSLFCTLFTGTVNFNEKIVKTPCCTGESWYYSWYGVGAEYFDWFDDEGSIDIFTDTHYAYDFDHSDRNLIVTNPGADANFVEFTPINVGASLTYHNNFDTKYPWARNNWGAGWPEPATITPVDEGSGTDKGWGIYGNHQYPF